jgi:tetratricopeptide (TPR) repeat protein
MLKNCLSLGALCLILLLLGNFLWPRTELFSTQLNTQRWPFSPISHLKMSQTYFNLGYETEAEGEYKTAQKLYQNLSFLDFNQNMAQSLVETEKLIYLPQKLEKQIQAWEEVLKTKPYARDVLLQLAALNYQLYQDEKAQGYWQQANYLDPNNPKVLEMGKNLE